MQVTSMFAIDDERKLAVLRFGAGLFGAWLVFALFTAQPYRLVINRTASEPEGIYLVHRLDASMALHCGQLVSFRYVAPWPIAPYTAYPNGAGFLKRIAGVPGDSVTSHQRVYTLTTAAGQHKALGTALTRTPSGVPVPRRAHYDGTPIPANHYYMVGDANPDSYDSRYYGLVPRSRIIGTARLLWRW